MTKETFEKLLEEKGITWNDIVIIHILNPNFRYSLFKKYPKTISFNGALGYTKSQNYVTIVTDPENQNKRSLFDCFFECDFLTFEFSQIIGIERTTTTRTYKNKKL